MQSRYSFFASESKRKVWRNNVDRRIRALGRKPATASWRSGHAKNYFLRIISGEKGRTKEAAEHVCTLLGVPLDVMVQPDADVSEETWPCPEQLRDW